VPIIDLRGSDTAGTQRSIARQVSAACQDLGTFYVVGHGIDADLIRRMERVSGDFFALPEPEKRRHRSSTGNPYRGWAPTEIDGPTGRVRLHQQFEVSRFDGPDDLREAGYSEEWAGGFESNSWPSTPRDFESTWKQYVAAMEDLAARLLRLMSIGLDLGPDWFDDKFARPASLLAANLYETPDVDEPTSLRLERHTDIGSITILHQDDAPGGLQILDDHGGWRDVPAVPDTLVVNLGDLFTFWTNGAWKVPEHRVPAAPPGARRRMSIAYFQNPDLDAVIECIPELSAAGRAQSASVVAGTWAEQRMAEYCSD
jgi:isopenicillin N synthase-like dioxygenase